ncbi:dihydroorotate dehydrogenase [SCandidatus Aminicenantes bacterium Aminicenantia_JdfR_composite]|jgi:dihydroorotate dehydrogenase (NAD+) catalytic subunit|nr:dihydroorotate dehydrogenase [SCandidatus Aminicenantes bacterium Aminicenantia_JdfR_composite]MCP2597179.1 dihydroorotate dehydrogenase [Candidatus Aminicenantes bacterium AC-335-G13]MCP2598292.1 dihydroorotate dehydrogenase [Candidatus Aminicenantes bacterium AC-335-L06]
MVDLTINLGFIKLRNPIITASGTFGYGLEFSPFLDLREIGAIIVKGLYFNEREGNPPPRIFETPCGMLNSIGLQGIGVKKFAEEILPKLTDYGVPIIVNVCGEEDDEYARVVEFLSSKKGISCFELNISCPNVRKDGKCPAISPEWTYNIVKLVKQSTKKPVITKLSPNVTDITEIAISAEEAGTDGISLINTILGMAVDIETRKPRLGNVFGGLSGPAIKPIALRMVYQVVNTVKVPVIGIGGIFKGVDALEFLIVGAKAVQVGTANLIDPLAPLRILNEIKDFCEKKGITKIEDIIGTLKVGD